MSGVEVVIEDLTNHPCCPHGPTILFTRLINGEKRKFFACSACRDRKNCPIFLYQDDLKTFSASKQQIWNSNKQDLIKNVNHKELYQNLIYIKKLPSEKRIFCRSCSKFQPTKFQKKHLGHDLINNLSDYQLKFPTEWLEPLENPKKEAQFLFSKNSIRTVVKIFEALNYKNVICLGTPRIHEFILNERPKMRSLLLDIDDRFHNFFSPTQFCWYNSFNHHFFLEESKKIFDNFIKIDCGEENKVLILDPPFGGRVELLAQTLKLIDKQFKKYNNSKQDLPIFWAFPYFMEPQILNSLPKFVMLDYKVDYDNHPLFQEGPKGRKQGSPVRIFTNVDPSKIKLPEEEGYKYCKLCSKWVSIENKHCKKCKSCTSKDGRTYIHCNKCERCVKPTWQHCEKCRRCAQLEHKCGEISFTQECFHCKEIGHKKRDCPKIDHEMLQNKRKIKISEKNNKKKRKS